MYSEESRSEMDGFLLHKYGEDYGIYTKNNILPTLQSKSWRVGRALYYECNRSELQKMQEENCVSRGYGKNRSKQDTS